MDVFLQEVFHVDGFASSQMPVCLTMMDIARSLSHTQISLCLTLGRERSGFN